MIPAQKHIYCKLSSIKCMFSFDTTIQVLSRVPGENYTFQ